MTICVFLEIDQVLQSQLSTVLKMADRNETPFLVATIAEIQRCANLATINLPHRITRDTVVHSYHLPSGTSIIPNIANVMIDEKFFPEPERFNPNRFLEMDGKSLRNLEMVIAFSLGKRSCLGESLARMELFLILGTMVQKFRFSASHGAPSIEPIQGFTRSPKPFEMTFTAR